MNFLPPQKWSRWILQRSRESWNLLSEAIRHPGAFQQFLVAKQAENATARSLLRTQKEWNDMRYYGLAPYLRSKFLPTGALSNNNSGLTIASSWFPSSSLSSSTLTSTNSSNESNGVTSAVSTPFTAKVAFMVTAKMKAQLAELGYSVDQIKAMKPVEASLVLANDVSPALKHELLPQLVKEHEEEQARQHEKQQQKQQQQQELEQQQEQQQQELEQQQHIQAPHQKAEPAAEKTLLDQISSTPQPPSSSSKTITTSSSSLASGASNSQGEELSEPVQSSSPSDGEPSSLPSSPSITKQLLGSIASENVLHGDTSSSSSSTGSNLLKTTRREWYEVVEEYINRDDGSRGETVALHPTENDALVDAKLRQEIVEKRAKMENKHVTVQYRVQKTLR